jgi:hypothetical protein
VRGNVRADSCGVNLNRMYKSPSRKRHPAVWAIRELMMHLAAGGGGSAQQTVSAAVSSKLALYVDMHAHANKRGAFFYGNAMPTGPQQVENLLYSKLVSLNSAFVGFTDGNFTSSNMYTLGKTGQSRDGSGRVVAFLQTGTVHSYTLECNSLIGPATNAVAALPQRGEEEKPGGAACPRYTPQTFYDIGRGLLQALADYHGVNPLSRISGEPFRSVEAVRSFVGAALYHDAAEQVRKRRDEFVVMSANAAPLDLDAECPISTQHGPRLPLPPCTTTTGGMSALQQYVAAAAAYGVLHLAKGGMGGMMSAGGGGPLRTLSLQNRAAAAAARRSSTTSAAAASTRGSSATGGGLRKTASSSALGGAKKRPSAAPAASPSSSSPSVIKQ